ELLPAESISNRIVRCCEEALWDGPMGQRARADFYRDFIACNDEPTEQAARALTTVHPSAALFVRAVRRWCGAPPAGPYLPGTAPFTALGCVGFDHPAFVPYRPGA